MGMVVGNIIRLTAKQRLNGIELLNTFFYEVGPFEVEPTYEDVAVKFAAGWGLAISELQSNALELYQVQIENLSNAVDIHLESVSVPGMSAGEYLPVFVTWTFRLNRSNLLTRSGRKAIAGVPENEQTNGVPTVGVAIVLDEASDFLGGSLQQIVGPDVDWSMDPVIIGRVETPPDSGNYVLDLTVRNPIQSAQFVRISTQNTRKS